MFVRLGTQSESGSYKRAISTREREREREQEINKTKLAIENVSAHTQERKKERKQNSRVQKTIDLSPSQRRIFNKSTSEPNILRRGTTTTTTTCVWMVHVARVRARGLEHVRSIF